MSIFSDRLINARKAMGWTRKRAVSEIGIPYPTYSNYEQGKREPDITTIAKFAEKLNTSTDYLLGRIDDPSPGTDKTEDGEITDADLDKMLDSAHSYDGQPMNEHDREVIKSYLKGYFQGKK
ncbi:helix-turn-helix domain-containing protein [Lactobacillus helveticus]|uniref:helix-turn-helix domain-containing protein n=1 Tax=Lactobacillus helveticus TaxID=1587 RepID=UPI0021A8050B|nr:helix-turn-helix transcriptional regulator [Lactobacillus helveticus]MCT3401230.1 XRE family transcriptional regulator [Lactobacillus helveticus]